MDLPPSLPPPPPLTDYDCNVAQTRTCAHGGDAGAKEMWENFFETGFPLHCTGRVSRDDNLRRLVAGQSIVYRFLKVVKRNVQARTKTARDAAAATARGVTRSMAGLSNWK